LRRILALLTFVFGALALVGWMASSAAASGTVAGIGLDGVGGTISQISGSRS